MNAASLLDVKVRPNGLGGYQIVISVFGKRHATIDTRVQKPDPQVSDVLYSIAMGFKVLGDAVKETEEGPAPVVIGFDPALEGADRAVGGDA